MLFKDNKKTKQNNRQYIFIGLVLLFLFIICFYIFSFATFQPLVLALQGNYNRISPADDQCTIDDWNYIDEDFLWKEGDTMTGTLNMGGNRITNLVYPPVSNTETATKQYLDNEIAVNIASAAGGDVFVNWGREVCPAGTNLLYNGIAFGIRYSSYSGGGNPACIQPGDAGGAYPGIYADKLYPFMTGSSAQLPAELPELKIIKCAVCYRNDSACFENFGSWNCPVPGFNMIYDGYSLGSLSGDHYNSHHRECINRNFEGTINSPAYGSIVYGSRIEDNFGQAGYDSKRFIKCAICCN